MWMTPTEKPRTQCWWGWGEKEASYTVSENIYLFIYTPPWEKWSGSKTAQTLSTGPSTSLVLCPVLPILLVPFISSAPHLSVFSGQLDIVTHPSLDSTLPGVTALWRLRTTTLLSLDAWSYVLYWKWTSLDKCCVAHNSSYLVSEKQTIFFLLAFQSGRQPT